MPLYLDTGDGGRKKIAAFTISRDAIPQEPDGQWPRYAPGKEITLRLKLADDDAAVDEQGSIRICQSLSEVLAQAARNLSSE